MSNLELREDQIEDLAKFIQFPRMLNKSGCGVGKTPVSCVYTEYEVNNENNTVVWIQPSSLIGKNIQELIKWSTIRPEQIGEISGSKQKKIEVCNNRRIKVFFLTADAWASEYGTLIRNNFNPKVIICDESQMYYRGWTSKRTSTFVKNLKPDTKVKFMTATPTPHGNLGAAYIYAHVMQQSYYKHHKYFMQIHAVYDEFDTLSGWENHEVLKELLDFYSICRTAKEVYGENEKFIVRKMIQMPKVQREAYKQFEDVGILELKDDTLSNKNMEGQMTLRLRQIMNSPHKIKIPSEWDKEGKPINYTQTSILKPDQISAKEQEIINYLQEGEPIAIFGVFQAELEHIHKVLTEAGFTGRIINGTVSGTERTNIDNQFREGKLDFVVCSVKTAAVGFNWGFLNTIIFHSMDYGDDDFEQACHRAIRGVRDQPLRVLILEYEDSIEPVILWKIHNKSKHTNKVNPHLDVIRFPALESNPLLQL